MANVVYTPAKVSLLSAEINLPTDNIKAVLVDTGTYTFSAAHQFLSDITSGARIATSGNLASKTVTGGVFDAADVTITGVTGNSFEAVVVYQDTGTAGTSRLIVYLDTSSTGSFSITPNGGDIVITWDNGASKIFAL